MITTPSNPLIVTGSGDLNITDNAILKRPITLKDFEENLLNESSTSTPASINTSNTLAVNTNHTKLGALTTQQPKTTAAFYIGNEPVSNSNYIRPNQLSFVNKKSEKIEKTKKSKYSSSASTSSAASTLSSRSSRSSTSDSSSGT